jgi:hypothetical protein
MKRALIATMISGALALSMTLPVSVLGIESGQIPVPVPLPDAAVVDQSTCSRGDGGLVTAQGPGCCRRNRGICGCRGRTVRCCDGTNGVGCACQGDSTPSEEL